ncbi:TPA: tyrosine-type recombinase/integrase [Salmonella enterica subsp. enterica serovar Birkenhead]
MTQQISRSIQQNFREQMVIGDQNQPGTFHQIDWQRAVALRRMAIAKTNAPKYLLAPEVSALLWYLDDLRQLAYFSTLWNTGARPNEALALSRDSFELSEIQPFVNLRTLKQRSRGKGRPRKDEKVFRTVPLYDAFYVRLMRQVFASFPSAKSDPIWPESHDTVSRWLSRALERAAADNVALSLSAVTPKTFRHSFAVHLLYNHISERELQEFMGHTRAESTQVYTRIFTLDASTRQPITFSFDGYTAAQALRLDTDSSE